MRFVETGASVRFHSPTLLGGVSDSSALGLRIGERGSSRMVPATFGVSAVSVADGLLFISQSMKPCPSWMRRSARWWNGDTR